MSDTIVSYTIPEPRKVRALRIPADGSRPHIITLQTIITEPVTPYEAHLKENELPRHVPNVTVFWGSSGWENRSHFLMHYGNESMKEAGYYVFLAGSPDTLPVNKHLANHLMDWQGDVFVLKMVERPVYNAADFVDVMDFHYQMQWEYLFPDFLDVDDEIQESDVVECLAKLLLSAALHDEEMEEMAEDDQETLGGTPTRNDACASAEKEDEKKDGGTVSSFPAPQERLKRTRMT
ncbi:hypothetical protein IMSHALPRED_007806 [Imshaugia aleurites]|uniref:Uncharacterized protein n=1 Tax=Imshaugia aleurites TaxID=172621 RepID=A0A8H3FTK4_9LECA|nr:hypothetical protein IMSHALPRED_007806 [Imshaugia aleurites]